MNVVIYGAGGHGADLAEIVRAKGYHVQWIDDDASKGYPQGVWGTDVIGVLVGHATPSVRALMAASVAAAPAMVHPTAVVSLNAAVGTPGVAIGAGTTVGPNVTLGRHTHIGAGCTVTRTTIGDYCQIAPGVDIAGDVTIGDRVFVGVGATIANLVTIGDDAVIGAGAVVLPNTTVPAGETWVGVPARPVRAQVAA